MVGGVVDFDPNWLAGCVSMDSKRIRHVHWVSGDRPWTGVCSDAPIQVDVEGVAMRVVANVHGHFFGSRSRSGMAL